MTIEEQVAKAVLQESDTLNVGGREYKIEQPSVATLIKVSALISTMPEYSKDDGSLVFNEVLAKAKDMKVVGEIAAYLILGVKRINEHRMVTICEETSIYRFNWRKMGKVKQVVKKMREREEKDVLADALLDLPSAQLGTIITERLKGLQINDFFMLTASLSGVNLTKRTKEAETQYGD